MDSIDYKQYRGFLPYATFGNWRKFALAKIRISQISYFMYAVTKWKAHKIALAKFLPNDWESFEKPQ